MVLTCNGVTVVKATVTGPAGLLLETRFSTAIVNVADGTVPPIAGEVVLMRSVVVTTWIWFAGTAKFEPNAAPIKVIV